MPLAEMSALAGGDLQQNVRIARAVLEGRPGAWRDIVVLNAGCAIYAADKADSVEEGIGMAKQAIDSGAALEKLELLKQYSHNKT
jgi:anthranilate phosphoribosyltransferase